MSPEGTISARVRPNPTVLTDLVTGRLNDDEVDALVAELAADAPSVPEHVIALGFRVADRAYMTVT